ncbi:MAG: hypothetical protein EXS10_07890 [Phycisphaerales bacterium]|nr:hypothetical protein [Phycisphaerales bacterium]
MDSTSTSSTDLRGETLKQAGLGDAMEGVQRAVGDLASACASRATRAAEFQEHTARDAEAERVRHQRAAAAAVQGRTDGANAAISKAARAVESAEERYSARTARLTEEYPNAKNAIADEAETLSASTKEKLDSALLLAEQVYEIAEHEAIKCVKDLRDSLSATNSTLHGLRKEALEFVRACRLAVPHEDDPSAEEIAHAIEFPQSALMLRLSAAQQHLHSLHETKTARLISGRAPIVVAVLLVLLGLFGGGATKQFADEGWDTNMAIGGGSMFALCVIAILVLRAKSAKALRAVWAPLGADLIIAFAAAEKAVADANAQRVLKLAEAKSLQAIEEVEAREKYLPRLLDIETRKIEKLATLEAQVHEKRGAIEAERVRALQEASEHRASDLSSSITLSDAADLLERETSAAQNAHLAATRASSSLSIRERWMGEATRTMGLLDAASNLDLIASPTWQKFDFANPPFATQTAPWFRFGQLQLNAQALQGGVPETGEFALERETSVVWSLPAALSIPSHGNVLFVASPDQRVQALGAVQSLVTRILLCVPPSKARFTFIDPVALGESFALFMHLADEFEPLVGERIWTEPRAIEQRLADLAEHMETVIQKYLRNEYESIDAYNITAGEIAEPYRFLVVADFPHAFSDQAAKRLASILRSGLRCGVQTILIRDPREPLPEGIKEEDLAQACQIVQYQSKTAPHGWTLQHGALSELALTLDTPAPDAKMIPLLGKLAASARSQSRVEVPFDAIAPKDPAFWSLSSAQSLRVPLGRTGATRIQQLVLGEGTSQHALVAGKTGSGKSSLMHTVITGIATWYSPDEVELWLVDFKKGVEFKTYAEHGLPHARAVAIESDREFGLSILEGLDAELTRRGELFREASVQDIASYRKVRPTARLPRVLLLIDEFQEFFLEDDRISQNAAQLLDRLVRQGRAFGMHALLGSQTLGGAFTLARATMGQMGVRIALQCNEADSQLILSDENVAARLLERPGEAIYNDAGGRVEGNCPFQVAWLPDAVRDRWLSAVKQHAGTRYDALPRIIFEGDAKPDATLHPHFTGAAVEPRGALRLWLGEAVAIKPPTCVRLQRSSGANLAVLASRDDQALTTSASVLLSIAKEAPGARVILLDGTPADAPEAGTLESIARKLGLAIEVLGYRAIDEAFLALAKEVQSRGDSSKAPPIFLHIHGIQRFRPLRRAEDDFSFSSSEGPPTPEKLLLGIVREGPRAGVHTIVVADNLASFGRAFDRNGQREFDWKAMYQLSATDSSALIDSPAASRLGTNRGILHSEELGVTEKFRPYAMWDPKGS